MYITTSIIEQFGIIEKISKNFGNIQKNLCKKQSLINVNVSHDKQDSTEF